MGSNKAAVGTGMLIGGAAGSFLGPVGMAGGALLGGGIAGILSGAGQTDYNYSGPELDWSAVQAGRLENYESRMNQHQVAQMLKDQAAGKGPSVAVNQLQQATNANQAQQAATAASARGGALSQAAAGRSAIYAGAQAQGNAAAQAATIRSQEQMGAQQQLQNQYNTMRGQDLQHLGTESQTMLGTGSLQNQAAGINAQVAMNNANNDSGMIGGMVKAGTGFLSDERAKKNITAADDEVGRFLSALSDQRAKRYEYKQPAEPGASPGEHFGLMAQDLEKAGPVGESIVVEDPKTGHKMIDVKNGFGALLASQAEIARRLERLETLSKGKNG